MSDQKPISEEKEETTPTLYEWHWDCGRMGELSGVFISTPAAIKAAVGEVAYFGEVLGKHSDIHGILEAKEFKKLDATPEFVLEFWRLFTSFGFNPLDYIENGAEE